MIMNSKYVMMSSAIILALCGIFTSFFPGEILNVIGITSNEIALLCLQMSGALYLGFAMMNWMAKMVIIGGIYARPLAMGNFLHFAVGALALIKGIMNHSTSVYVWVACAFYLVFAILFGIILFNSPQGIIPEN